MDKVEVREADEGKVQVEVWKVQVETVDVKVGRSGGKLRKKNG